MSGDPVFDAIVVRCSAADCGYEYDGDVEQAWETYEEDGFCPGCFRSAEPEVVVVNRLDDLLDAAREIEETAAMIVARQPGLAGRLDETLAAPRALVASLLETIR